MDALTFIVEMTKALVWPLAVSAGVFALRKPLLDLIPFLEELKYKEFSLRFHRQVVEAKEQIEQSEAVESLPAPVAAEHDALLRVARLSPRAAVLEAWLYLESTLLDISVARGQIGLKHHFRGHSRLGHAMLELKAFDEPDFQLFHRLLKLRNEAANAPELALTSSDAEEYVSLAIGLANRAKSRDVRT
jgi:hypothetical protein